MNNRYIKPVILVISLLVFFAANGIAVEKLQPRMKVTYKKMTDGVRRITVLVFAVDSGNKVYPEGGIIEFFATRDSGSSIALGSSATDWKGKTTFEIPADRKLPKATDGNYSILATYKGSDKFEPVENTVSARDIVLELSFDEADTSKTIYMFAYEPGPGNIKNAVSGIDIDFCVTRIYGLFPFGTAKTDSTGRCSMAFSRTIPGDSLGEVMLVARMMDNETYANAETRKAVKWGVPFIPELKQHRGLGDTDAPLWMVYTLIVLLSGVWIHFSYIIYLVLRINSIGKKMLKTQASQAV
jgi:hypothetical protein